MNCEYRSTNKMNVINIITEYSNLTDIEMQSLHDYIVKHLNDDEFSISFGWAVDNGKIEIVRNLMNDYNLKQIMVKHLARAIKFGHVTIIDHFINYCPCTTHLDIDLYPEQRGTILNYALNLAIKYNQIEIVKHLINKDPNIIKNTCGYYNGMYYRTTNFPIIASISDERVEITAYLIKMNCPFNNTQLLYCDEIYSCDSVANMIIENCNMNSDKDVVLVYLARFGYLDKVKHLVESGATFRGSRWCTFNECIKRNSIEVLEYLLKVCLEKNQTIPNDIITHDITDANKILVKYVSKDKLHLFHPTIIKTLKYPKSARNVFNN